MLRFVSVVVVFACSITLAPAAHAQMPQRWNGPYIGASVGHGSAQFDSTTTVGGVAGTSLSDSINDNSVFGGIQAGFNRRIGNFFVGLEADLQTADFSGSSRSNSPSFTYAASASIDWFGTARARAGFATDTALVYVTGGFAFGGVDYDALVNTGGTSVHLSEETRFGYVLGAGLEFALRANWSLKLEYQYLNFGNHGASGAFTTIINNNCAPPTIVTTPVSTEFDTDVHTVRIGLNYHFYAPQRHEPLKP